ncbi:MAG: PQQ-binding-like beta-propeller repeat protein, partial [Actinomycetia bacterium]|nr:PQQ-binding-like beta-propeller repeat protein [Actinomycetes bacterium]
MKKALVLLLAAALVILVMAAGTSAQEADEWSQFQKDAGNTGSIDVAIPGDNTVSNKTAAMDARAGSQPAVSGNRAYVYNGVDDTSGSIACFDLSTHQKVWEKTIDPPTNWTFSSPTVSGGVVYIGSGSKVHALNAADGAALWTRDLATLAAGASIANCSPTVVGNHLFIGDWQNGIYYCLDVADSGNKVWSFQLDAGSHAQSTPAVDGDRVFVGQFSDPAGSNGKVWCLDRSDGKPVASWGTNGCFETANKLDVTGSVAVDGDYIYFTDYDFNSADSHLYCVGKADGKEAWQGSVYPTSGTPAVGDGIVVSAGDDFHTTFTPRVSAFAAGAGSGGAAAPLWTADGFGGWKMSPSIADGKVAVGIDVWGAPGVAVLDATDGGVVWQSTEGNSTPVPTAYGLLSISAAGELVTFGAGAVANGDFYFAEGTTRDGYQEWICLENPGATQIDANIQYMLTDGSVRDQPVMLPADSRTTVDVNLFLGLGVDASAHVTGNGYFVAERSMYVDTETVSGGEQVMGVTDPGKSFLFAEGT